MIKRREEALAVRSQLNAATVATGVATDVATGLDLHAFTAFVSSSPKAKERRFPTAEYEEKKRESN